MGLLETLRTLGTKLRVLQIAPAAPSADPAKIPTQAVTLSELTTEVRSEEVRALAQLPAEMGVPFEKVYATAGIKPAAHGWTIERLAQLLRTAQYKSMDRSATQQALLGLLAAEKARVEDLVRDAVSRDQALDAFQAFVRKKMNDRLAMRESLLADRESQIRALQEECARMCEETRADQRQWQEWLERKRGQERELAWAVSYLLDHPVISIEGESDM